MAVSEKLRKLYKDAQESNIVIKEFPADKGFIAFAGSRLKLENAGFDKETRKRMDFMQASLYMAGEAGDTREEAVEKAIDMFKQSETWIPITKNTE